MTKDRYLQLYHSISDRFIYNPTPEYDRVFQAFRQAAAKPWRARLVAGTEEDPQRFDILYNLRGFPVVAFTLNRGEDQDLSPEAVCRNLATRERQILKEFGEPDLCDWFIDAY